MPFCTELRVRFAYSTSLVHVGPASLGMEPVLFPVWPSQGCGGQVFLIRLFQLTCECYPILALPRALRNCSQACTQRCSAPSHCRLATRSCKLTTRLEKPSSFSMNAAWPQLPPVFAVRGCTRFDSRYVL